VIGIRLESRQKVYANERLQSARITVLLFRIAPFVQAARPDAPPENRIKNFGRISESYYRGAQPKTGDYVYLASLGIRTVIDLERGGDSGKSKPSNRPE
jgi:hypothetical protein